MADSKPKRRIKKSETIRERAQKSEQPEKTRRIKKTADAVGRPLKAAHQKGRKEFHLVKLPDNKAGRLLGKRIRFMPKFLRNAWEEVRQVQWPNARETTKLTTAVIIFAVIFGALIWIVDYGLNKLFREVLLG